MSTLLPTGGTRPLLSTPPGTTSSGWRWLLLFLATWLSAAGGAQAQTAVIGTTALTGTNSYLYGPFYRSSAASTFNYSRYAHLYTAAELSAQGITAGATITGEGWLKSDAATITANNTFEVRLGNTLATTLTSGSSWGTLKTGTTVAYSSTTQAVTGAASTYFAVTNSAGFVYTGGSLLVLMDWVKVGTASAAVNFVTNSATGLGIGAANSAALTDATTLSTTTYGNRRPTLRLTYTAGAACTGTPAAGTATASPASICSGSSSIGLSGGTSAGSITYQLQSSPTLGGSYTNVGTASSSSSFSVSPTASTYYQIVTTCTPSGLSATSTPVQLVVVAPAYAAVPFSETFESTWSSTCGTRDVPTNNWRSSPLSGNTAWRRYDDGTAGGWSGTSGAYTPAGNASSFSARFHSFNATSGTSGQLDLYVNTTGSGSPTLTFDYINPTGTDNLVIKTSTDGTTFTTLTAGTLVAQASWTTYSFTLPSNATTMVRFLATSDFGNDDIGLDNVGVNLLACPAATGLVVSGITSSQANLNFTVASGTTNYTVTTTPATNTYSGVTTGSVTLTSLASNTAYTVNVVGNCTAGGTSTATTSFTTLPASPAFTTSRTTGATFTSISGTGTGLTFPSTSTDDNTSNAVTLPFAFTYQGTAITQFKVCTNGWITLDPTVTATTYFNALGVTPPSSVLAPFWEDLVCQGNNSTALSLAASMTYLVTGTAPNRVLVVEWSGMETFNNAGPNLNFQVKLYETSNNIEFVYGTMSAFNGTANYTFSYSVGLNGSTNVSAGNYLAQQVANSNFFAQTNAGTTNVGANGLTIVPTCNTMLRFVPGTFATGSAPVAAAPGNDEPTSATVLTLGTADLTDFCTVYTSALATATSGITACSAATPGTPDDDVWFKFDVSVLSDVTVKLRSSGGYDGVLQLFYATAGGALSSPLDCKNATGTGLTETSAVTALNPGTYYVRVYHAAAGSGTDGTFTVVAYATPAPPANDNCAGAISLAATSTTCTPTAGTTITATASTQAACTGTPDDDVWYSFNTGTGTAFTATLQSGSGFNGVLEVLSGTCAALTSTNCVNNTSTGGAETVMLTGLTTSTTYYLRVYHAAAGAGTGNFTICVTQACNAPTAVSSANVTDVSADITFTAGAGNTSYTVTATPASGPAVTNTGATSPIALTGLTAGTSYTVVVQGNCNASATSAPYNFTTSPPCAASTYAALPYTQGFEATWIDNCGQRAVPSLNFRNTPATGNTSWRRDDDGPAAAWTSASGAFTPAGSNAGGGSSTRSARFHSYDATSGAIGTFDLYLNVSGGTGTPTLSFDYLNTSGTDKIEVLLSTDGGTTFGPVLFTQAVAAAWTRYTVPLTGATATSVVRFRSTSDFGFTDIGLDNVSVSIPADVTVTAANSPFSLSGSYNNITIASGGVANMTAATFATGTVTVASGGSLSTNCQILSGIGSFVLQADGSLSICNPAGITASGATGAVQVTSTRTFSTDASYTYNGTVAQVTGNGLTGARNLTVNNAADLTLSQATAVSQLLTLTSGNLVSGGLLTLLSSGGLSATVVNTGTNVVTGSTIVQRSINTSLNAGIGYRHFSSPVAAQPFTGLAAGTFTPVLNTAYNGSATPYSVSPFPNVFGYDEARIGTVTNNIPDAFSKGWVVPTVANMAIGQGYTVNISAANTVAFTGTLNNGTQSVALTRTGSNGGSGLALVGNPYPAPLDFSLVAAGDRTGLDGTAYIFFSTDLYNGNYRTYKNGIGNPIIPSGQGFFVQVATGNTTGALTFRNTQRKTTFDNATLFQRGAADSRPLLALTVTDAAGLSDQAHVYFENGATPAHDLAFDARKLPNSNGLNLASLAGTEDLAINGLPLLANAQVLVPVSLTAPAAGSYTLRVDQLANFGTATVTLRDALTGTATTLTPATVLTVRLSNGANNGRFTLVFNPAAAPLAAGNAALATQLGLYPNPAHESFTLTVPPVANAQKATATLCNALGQVMSTQVLILNAAGARAEFRTASLAPGIYALTLRIGNETATRRVVVE